MNCCSLGARVVDLYLERWLISRQRPRPSLGVMAVIDDSEHYTVHVTMLSIANNINQIELDGLSVWRHFPLHARAIS